MLNLEVFILMQENSSNIPAHMANSKIHIFYSEYSHCVTSFTHEFDKFDSGF
jgi:hypothetical protein